MVADSRNEFGDGASLRTERYIKSLTMLMETLRAEIESREAR